MYRKRNCLVDPRIGQFALESQDQELGILDQVDPSSSVFSMLPMNSVQASAMQSVPIEPPPIPYGSSEPCPPVDCDKCPVKIVYREKRVIVPGTNTVTTVKEYVYVPVFSTQGVPSGGFSQQELASMYSAGGGTLPSGAGGGLPDESSGEGSDYGVRQAQEGDSKPFPWWLLAVGAGAYFWARKKRTA